MAKSQSRRRQRKHVVGGKVMRPALGTCFPSLLSTVLEGRVVGAPPTDPRTRCALTQPSPILAVLPVSAQGRWLSGERTEVEQSGLKSSWDLGSSKIE